MPGVNCTASCLIITLRCDPFNIPNWGPFTDLAPELPGLARQGGFDALDASPHSATADGLNEFMFGHGPNRRFVADMGPVDVVDAQQMIAGWPERCGHCTPIYGASCRCG